MKGTAAVKLHLKSRRVWPARTPRDARAPRGFVPGVVTLFLVLAAAVLLAMSGQHPASATNANGSATNTSTVAVRPALLARADMHADTPYKGEDLELNLIITQDANDCQDTLSSGFCLRYSAVLDEKTVLAGYGVIATSAVHVTPSLIVLTVDTSKIATFTHVVGKGVRIVMTWRTNAPSAKGGILHGASVVGSVGSYRVPVHGVVASTLFH